jgi:DNA-binding protein HU-beta
MNKSDLIDHICANVPGLSLADGHRALTAALDGITMTVSAGGTVTLVGFGSFKSAARKARAGRNPATGAAIDIPAATVPKFTPGSEFKALVNASTKPAKGKK